MFYHIFQKQHKGVRGSNLLLHKVADGQSWHKRKDGEGSNQGANQGLLVRSSILKKKERHSVDRINIS